MYKILKAEELTTNIFLMEVEAARVAKKCMPGQFLIVRTDEDSERIPLTICDYDREAGTITIVVQIVGASTEKMSHLKAGDAYEDFVGPLGCPSELISKDIEQLKKMNIVFIAGGLGTAPVYPQVSASVQEVLENSVLTDNDAKTELDKSVERINAKLKRYVMK